MKKFPNFNLEQYFNEKGIIFRRHEGDHVEYSICCYDCVNNGKSADTEFKNWINAETGSYYCYRCDSRGSIVRLIQVIERIPKIMAMRKLVGDLSSLDYLSFTLHNDSYFFDLDEDSIQEISLPYGFIGFDEATKRNMFHDYLIKRGISVKYAIQHDWGFCRTGYLANRIVVPMYINNRLVFWQARDVLEDKHPQWKESTYRKTLNPSGVSARHVLYNYDSAKHFDEVILVEGFVDAVKAGPSAMACNGKVLHSRQLELLTQTKAKRVVVMFDPDAFESKRGKPSAVKTAIEKLTPYFNVTTIQLPNGRDAGSYNYKTLQRIISNCKQYKK